jgi:coatomer protein complex subunit alpha (xenin)
MPHANLLPDLKPQSRRRLFTLHGHLDYVRSVRFHHEMPWIVSSIAFTLLIGLFTGQQVVRIR